MRTLSFLFALSLSLATALSLEARQSLALTPRTLAGWNLTGADARELAQQSELALPAGAQIARTFAAGNLTLEVSSLPAIGQKPGDWPVLELGSAALVFSRHASTGKLVLVLGEDAPLELPFRFPLDAEGRSLGPVGVVLAREGASINLTVAGQTLRLPTDAVATDPTPVVISSGSSQPWSLPLVELTGGANGAPPADASPGAASSANPDAPRAAPSGGMGAALGLPADIAAPAPRIADTDRLRLEGLRAPAAASDGSLEVFTPPAVRYGRANDARRSVARNIRN